MQNLPVPLAEYKERIKNCKEETKKAGFDALLVFSHTPDRPGNVMYLANYSSPVSLHPSNLPDQPVRRGICDACLILPVEGEPVLVKMGTPVHPDHVFPPPTNIAVSNIKEFHTDITAAIAEVIYEKKLDDKKIGIAGEDVISAHLLRLIKEKVTQSTFSYADDIIYKQRIIKSPNEIELMKKTANLADEALETTLKAIKPGVKEKEIAGIAAQAMASKGATRILFIDVCSGPVSTWYTGNRTIEKGDIVLIDLGMVDENGYFADVARTIVVGESSKAKHDLVRLCRETTDFIARTAVPGKRGKEWLQETREFVKQRIATGNYDMPNPEPIMFLGHSIGLDMNSYYFGPDADMELKENMSLALEAWLYVPQIGAVRFEELIIIKNEGAQFLTKYRYQKD